MSNDTTLYEQIDRYLDGKMWGEELISFEAAISKDASLQEEIILAKAARELIVDHNLATLKTKLKTFQPSKKNTWKYWGLGGLLFIGVLVGISLWPSNETVVEKTFIDINAKHEESIMPQQLASNAHKAEHKDSTSIKKTTNKAVLMEQQKPLITPLVKDENLVEHTDSVESTSTKLKDTLPDVTKNNPELPNLVSCNDFHLSIDIEKENTCKGTASGMIKVMTVSGGTTPYLYSLDADNYSDHGLFKNLKAGNYTLIVKDHNDCVDIKDVKIENRLCGPKYVEAFNPAAGEKWLIPYDSDLTGTLRITNRKGQTVFTKPFSSQQPEHWLGENNSGEKLPMGYYIFELEYANGKTFGGGISIVR